MSDKDLAHCRMFGCEPCHSNTTERMGCMHAESGVCKRCGRCDPHDEGAHFITMFDFPCSNCAQEMMDDDVIDSYPGSFDGDDYEFDLQDYPESEGWC